MRKNQPEFYYSDNNLPVKAGGVIFYHIDENNVLSLLLIKNRNKYEDFGGKTDSVDSCYQDTVAREVEEESNGYFKKDYILKEIKNKQPIYTKNSKYIIYFIELNEYIDPTIFGDKEIYENIPRTVEWVRAIDLKKSKFIRSSLNFRLRFKDFFDKINSIIDNIHNKLLNEIENTIDDNINDKEDIDNTVDNIKNIKL